MADLLTRRSFLVAVPVLCAAPTLLGTGRAAEAAAPQTDSYPAGGDPFPAQDPARVRAIVGASHGNLARVQELLTESPAPVSYTHLDVYKRQKPRRSWTCCAQGARSRM